jgi:YfiH family protein
MSPVVRLVKADWPAPAAVQAWVTERAGGVSSGRYESLNLAQHVGDDPDCVVENRRRLESVLGLPGAPAWLEQVHGNRVLDLDRAPPGAADGAVTSRRGVVCAVLTADCLPVVFCDRRGGRVGVAHAGWRGLAAGVLGEAVAAMRAEPHDLMAWLGPAIGPEAYEVGGEVRDAFVREDAGASQAFRANSRGRWQADLYRLARRALTRLGVAAVHGGDFCTHREVQRFFSHRRQSPCGRMATLVWLDG